MKSNSSEQQILNHSEIQKQIDYLPYLWNDKLLLCLKYPRSNKELEEIINFVLKKYPERFDSVLAQLKYQNIEQLRGLSVLAEHLDKIPTDNDIKTNNLPARIAVHYQTKYLLGLIKYIENDHTEFARNINSIIEDFPKYLKNCNSHEIGLLVINTYADALYCLSENLIDSHLNKLSFEEARTVCKHDEKCYVITKISELKKFSDITSIFDLGLSYSHHAGSMLAESSINSVSKLEKIKGYIIKSFNYINSSKDDYNENMRTVYKYNIIDNILNLMIIENKISQINSRKIDLRCAIPYVSLLKNPEDAQLLNFEIKSKHLQKYNPEKFKTIDKESLSLEFKSSHDCIAFKIKYTNSAVECIKSYKDDISVMSFDPVSIRLHSIDRGAHYASYMCQVTGEIIKSRLYEGKNIKDHILDIFTESSNNSFFNQTKLFKFSKSLSHDDKIEKIKYSLENIYKYTNNNNCQNFLRKMIRQGLSLEQIEAELRRVFGDNELESKSASQKSKLTTEVKIEQRENSENRPKKVKVKTKGKAQKLEKIISEQHDEVASWVIDGEVFRDGERNIFKAFEKESFKNGQKNITSYYVLINDKLSLNERVETKFKTAATKGFVKADSKGVNGFKNLQKKIIELKIKGDLRLYTDKWYINEDGEILIILDKQGNHEIVNKAVLLAKKSLEEIFVNCDDSIHINSYIDNSTALINNNIETNNSNYNNSNDQPESLTLGESYAFSDQV